MKIRKLRRKDFEGIMKVARSLHPKWFDEFAINKTIPLDLKIQNGFVAEEKGEIVGFITFTSYDGAVKIGWIGVKPKFQGQRIGTKLIKRLEKELKRIGVKELEVETVARSTKYKPYESTRAFYEKTGFRVKKVRRTKSKVTGEKFDLATYLKVIE